MGLLRPAARMLFVILLATPFAASAPRGHTPAKRESTSSRTRRLYDRGCLFSPEGRIYQVEYARKAVASGSFAVGVCGADGIALAAVRSTGARAAPEALLAENWNERVFYVDERIVAVACGVVPDAASLLKALRKFAQAHRQQWGEAPPVEVVAKQLGRHAQKTTQRAGGRPFGAAFLLAGFDGDDPAPKLFLTDPSGSYETFAPGSVAVAGAAPDEALEALRAGIDAGAAVDACAGAALTAALAAADAAVPPGREAGELRASDVELAVLSRDACAVLADGDVRARFDAAQSAGV